MEMRLKQMRLVNRGVMLAEIFIETETTNLGLTEIGRATIARLKIKACSGQAEALATTRTYASG